MNEPTENIERMARRMGLAFAAGKLLRGRDSHQSVVAVLPDDTVSTIQALLADVPADSAVYLAWRVDGELQVLALTEVTPPDLPVIGGSSPSPEIAPPGRA